MWEDRLDGIRKSYETDSRLAIWKIFLLFYKYFFNLSWCIEKWEDNYLHLKGSVS